ncbi:transcription elongation GreA/GreB family factor [Streptomyces sp. PanSC19]|uniref:GreA/GreB family elongation factor n=1 Tax=Streptomyces sp. PanSC19 TaxID=1520455 RepID=UPI000F46EC1D|nr:GreA/GreB family elongation factor [Streptomyces sp. PanSC19]ROQ35522.1 transcription elongation GreA/GreB family factor [Streptomyces sp. PanSC19]
MTGGPEPISAVAREELERELAELRTEREAVAATLRDGGGDEVGDRADQADELQRADDLDRLDADIQEIEGRLREASVAPAPSSDAVGVGSSVTVRFEDGTESTVQIGELANALDATLVTADSPLGRALLGHGAGDTVTYETPEGRTSAVVVSLG